MDSDEYYYTTKNNTRSTVKVWICMFVLVITGVSLIYSSIKCCCPTSLMRVRPGMVFSGDPLANAPSVMPLIRAPFSQPLQLVQMSYTPPVQPIPFDNYQTAPPAYMPKDPDDSADVQTVV